MREKKSKKSDFEMHLSDRMVVHHSVAAREYRDQSYSIYSDIRGRIYLTVYSTNFNGDKYMLNRI